MADPTDDTKTGLLRSAGGAAMRRALLRKLPPLEYHGQSVLALELEDDSDLRGAIELDVDAFLTPLEATTRTRRST